MTTLAMWDAPPNFLVVDYYNVGNGSVFEAAAKANGVTYSRTCCGVATTSMATSLSGSTLVATLSAVFVSLFILV